MIVRQLVLCWVGDIEFVTVGMAYIARRQYIHVHVINTCCSGGYGETLHSCAAFVYTRAISCHIAHNKIYEVTSVGLAQGHHN